MIFTFGSNLSGIHGAGAALTAYQLHGAIWGQGEGLQGNSYGLPTKGLKISYMPLPEVATHVQRFLDFAAQSPELGFQITRVGCGLAGFDDSEIAPMFTASPKNCFFDIKWRNYLGTTKEYWGTF